MGLWAQPVWLADSDEWALAEIAHSDLMLVVSIVKGKRTYAAYVIASQACQVGFVDLDFVERVTL